MYMPLLWDPTVLIAVPGAGTLLVDVKPLLFFFFKKILSNLLAFLFFLSVLYRTKLSY